MKDDKFEFSYKALSQEQKKEVESIKNQYQQTEENKKLERIKELDHRVKAIPTCIGISIGIAGFSCFGLGMAMVLEWSIFIYGIILSILGLMLMGTSYFIYRSAARYMKKKYGEEIVRLSDEILNTFTKS